jgi:hypothetical protein
VRKTVLQSTKFGTKMNLGEPLSGIDISVKHPSHHQRGTTNPESAIFRKGQNQLVWDPVAAQRKPEFSKGGWKENHVGRVNARSSCFDLISI